MPLAIVAGAAITPGTITGESGRMLVTFLGLVSASILPTISLLINSMSASGRSVKAVNELESELQNAMDALFLLFGCVALVVGALVALITPAPIFLNKVPYLTAEILPRLGQAIVFLATTMILLRIGHIPGILRRALSIRHKIALDEARRSTIENAPTSSTSRAAFPTHPEFGKSVNMYDLPGRDS